MTPSRIIHCIDEPQHGGSEFVAVRLASAMVKAGHPTAFVSFCPCHPAFRKELDCLTQQGCELFIPERPLGRLQRILWVRQITGKFHPNIIFSHTFYNSISCRLATLLFARTKVVTVLHSIDDFDIPKAQKVGRWLRDKKSVVVAVSPLSLKKYRELVTDKQKTKLIPNGINLDVIREASESRQRVRREIFRAEPGQKILMQVGSILPVKRQLQTVEALGALSKHISLDRIRLVFVGVFGDQDYHQKALAAVESLGLKNYIEFLGPRNDVPELLAGADVYIMPSEKESHSLAALEALASGIYCVFSPIAAFEPFREWENVSILPNDYISEQFAQKLLEATQATETSDRSEHDMKKYSFENTVAEYSKIIEELR
jgi:glycosyltransferase involved in cell wall biosynthesis